MIVLCLFGKKGERETKKAELAPLNGESRGKEKVKVSPIRRSWDDGEKKRQRQNPSSNVPLEGGEKRSGSSSSTRRGGEKKKREEFSIRRIKLLAKKKRASQRRKKRVLRQCAIPCGLRKEGGDCGGPSSEERKEDLGGGLILYLEKKWSSPQEGGGETFDANPHSEEGKRLQHRAAAQGREEKKNVLTNNPAQSNCPHKGKEKGERVRQAHRKKGKVRFEEFSCERKEKGEGGNPEKEEKREIPIQHYKGRGKNEQVTL